MTRLNKILFTISIIILIVVGFSVLKTRDKKELPTIKAQAQDKLISRENDGGNVTVTVKPITLKVGEKPVFDLEFNTHSIDLSFNVAKQSYLIYGKGNYGYGNRLTDGIWNGSPEGGHHREGTLAFNSVLLSETKFVELIIKNVAGVTERKFKWNL